MSVLKWLKREKPEKITQEGNNVEIVAFGQKKVISNTVNIFLNDPLMRDALARAVQPLRQPGYERIRLEPRDAAADEPVEPMTIEKEEAPYLEADPVQLANARNLLTKASETRRSSLPSCPLWKGQVVVLRTRFESCRQHH